MKQHDILNVLNYIFEISNENRGLIKNDKALFDHLVEAGFESTEITNTLHWLKNLSSTPGTTSNSPKIDSHGGFRTFSDFESQRLDAQCQNYLYILERESIIDDSTREHIINLLLELPNPINLNLVKWITFMVSCNSQLDEDSFMKLDLLSSDLSHQGVQ